MTGYGFDIESRSQEGAPRPSRVGIFWDDKAGGFEAGFYEQKPVKSRRDILSVKLKISAKADIHALDGETFSQLIFDFIEAQNSANPYAQGLAAARGRLIRAQSLRRHALGFVQDLLETILLEAEGKLPLLDQQRRYKQKAWDRAIKTMRPAFRGTITFDGLRAAQEAAYQEHVRELAAFIEEQKNKRAPIPRQLADVSKLEQAARLGLELQLSGAVPVKETLEAFEEELAKRHEEGGAKRFALAALGRLQGLETLALLTLIQRIREKGGADRLGLQGGRDSFYITEERFLKGLGFDTEEATRPRRQRIREEVRETLKGLAQREILLPAAQKERGRLRVGGFRSGFFLFEYIEAELTLESGETVPAGSYAFKGLDLVQVLTEEDMPFLDIHPDPLRYILQEADARERDRLMSLAFEFQLYAGQQYKRPQAWQLSDYGLALGKGIRREAVEEKRELLKRAMKQGDPEGELVFTGSQVLYTPGRSAEKKLAAGGKGENQSKKKGINRRGV